MLRLVWGLFAFALGKRGLVLMDQKWQGKRLKQPFSDNNEVRADRDEEETALPSAIHLPPPARTVGPSLPVLRRGLACNAFEGGMKC
ncbi:hypothetical protein GCM10023187_49530 [Nibrella viscosa]|uniref:Secreted protein n=1 Tax=Nibrella viscosa TaxID=1084524 RepID=A0ABP8KVV9_9BACT